jgi:HD superfamily phosphohydrolase
MKKLGLAPADWIYDNVHGYIPITETERRIIDTKIFQRLRRISHLGLASFVYPGATHTRFAHSLGALFVMDKMCESLIPQGYVNADDRHTLRLSALLHDIGQAPFSHVIDRLFSDEDKTAGHVQLGISLIRTSEIRDILSKDSFSVDEIEKMLLKRKGLEYPTYSDLLDSDMDVDKIDYLLRDSLHTGVTYGAVDAQRLLRTITADPEGGIAVQDRGKHAVENLIIARYHMFQTVYWHKTVAAFELMLRRAYEELLKEPSSERVVPDTQEVKKMCSDGSVDRFCRFDDASVFNAMRAYRGNNKFLTELVGMLWGRQRLKMTKEQIAFTEGQESQEEGKEEGKESTNDLFAMDLEEEAQKVCKKAGIAREWLFGLKISPTDFFSSSPVKVEKDGEFTRLDADKTSIVSILAHRLYSTYRVYTKSEYSETLEGVIDDWLAERRGGSARALPGSS